MFTSNDVWLINIYYVFTELLFTQYLYGERTIFDPSLRRCSAKNSTSPNLTLEKIKKYNNYKSIVVWDI